MGFFEVALSSANPVRLTRTGGEWQRWPNMRLRPVLYRSRATGTLQLAQLVALSRRLSLLRRVAPGVLPGM